MNIKKNRGMTCLFGCFCVLIGAFALQETDTYASERKIPVGITIDNIDVGGMTYDEAMETVDEYISESAGKTIELDVDGKKAAVKAEELGYFWENTGIVEEAAGYCREGNIIQRYKEAKDIEKNGIHYDIKIQINEEELRKTIDEKCGVYNVPHVNARLKRENGAFSISQEASGRIIDMDRSVEEIKEYLLDSWDGGDGKFTLTVVDDHPVSTVEDCRKVNAIIGTYTTNFTTGGGNYNRNKNMENGVNMLNGVTLCPGETMSANALLEPWTEDNGWKEAGTYVNGRVENSLGGGICQVSTTLYNAVLDAELEIVERFNHSMSVGYVPLSMDAALAGTWKDLKFSNNMDIPVYVEGIYDPSGKITFNIYGQETRPANRKVEYVSETTGSTPSQEIVTQDPSLPSGYRSVTERGHNGSTARLWKKVYVDGVLVSEEIVNKSTYAASPTYVTLGTGEVATEPPTVEPPAVEPSTTEPETEPKTEKKTEPATEKKTEAKTESKTEAKTEEKTRPQKETESKTSSKKDD